jgi:hypothetical protein
MRYDRAVTLCAALMLPAAADALVPVRDAAPPPLCTYFWNPRGMPKVGTPEWARWLVLRSESVVLVRALGQEPSSIDAVDADPRAPIVTVLEVRRVLRGRAVPDTIRLRRAETLAYDMSARARDDFFSGSGGVCWGTSFRRLGLHLVLLGRDSHGTLGVEWAPNGPLVRELRGQRDPWLRWVERVVRDTAAPVGPMDADNDSLPWVERPGAIRRRHDGVTQVHGWLAEIEGAAIPGAEIRLEGFAEARTMRNGAFAFRWPDATSARLEVRCASPRGDSVTVRLREFAGTVRPWVPSVPRALVWTLPAGRCRSAPGPRGPQTVMYLWNPSSAVESFGGIPNWVLSLGDPVLQLDDAAAARAHALHAAEPHFVNARGQALLCFRGTIRSPAIEQWDRVPAFELRVTGASSVWRPVFRDSLGPSCRDR